jgi:hypothetical protein
MKPQQKGMRAVNKRVRMLRHLPLSGFGSGRWRFVAVGILERRERGFQGYSRPREVRGLPLDLPSRRRTPRNTMGERWRGVKFGG